MCELYGAPGVGKSYVALKMAAEVAQTKRVLYLATDGQSGLVPRVDAFEAFSGMTTEHLSYIVRRVRLSESDEVQSFISELQEVAPDLLVVDMLSRCIPGVEENSTREMGLVLENCDAIRNQLECAALLHHTNRSGKDDRGSTVIPVGCFSMARVTKTKVAGRITVESTKLRDGEPFATYDAEFVK